MGCWTDTQQAKQASATEATGKSPADGTEQPQGCSMAGVADAAQQPSTAQGCGAMDLTNYFATLPNEVVAFKDLVTPSPVSSDLVRRQQSMLFAVVCYDLSQMVFADACMQCCHCFLMVSTCSSQREVITLQGQVAVPPQKSGIHRPTLMHLLHVLCRTCHCCVALTLTVVCLLACRAWYQAWNQHSSKHLNCPVLKVLYIAMKSLMICMHRP